MSINKELRNRLDFVRGSLIGGAAGDALGYPIEFDHYSQIIAKYGKQGITQYELTNGVAEISDDTQMCSGIGLDGKLDYGMIYLLVAERFGRLLREKQGKNRVKTGRKNSRFS